MAAADAAAARAAPPATVLPAPSAPPPVPNKCTYKNRLQELAQRTHQKLPIYHSEYKVEHHQLRFRSTIEVGSERFSSVRYHSRIKDAEQDAARVAYEILVRIDDDDLTDMLGLIDQDMVFCKSILYEYAVKTKATQPTYSVDKPEGLGPMILFVSSVLFAGNTYTGEAAKSKKDAEQKAARAAVKSILATNNTCMLQIIRSKKRLIAAITSSGFNKERGAVSQENLNAPTNALPPVATIQFVRAVGSSYPTADQGANIIPVADPSPQAVPGSKKRRKKRTRGPHATEERVDEQQLMHRNMRMSGSGSRNGSETPLPLPSLADVLLQIERNCQDQNRILEDLTRNMGQPMGSGQAKGGNLQPSHTQRTLSMPTIGFEASSGQCPGFI